MIERARASRWSGIAVANLDDDDAVQLALPFDHASGGALDAGGRRRAGALRQHGADPAVLLGRDHGTCRPVAAGLTTLRTTLAQCPKDSISRRSAGGWRPTSRGRRAVHAALIAGGRSNLTFTVTGADGRRFVVRRPPLGHVLATAHDMAREHRIIAAVGTTGVPVPPTLGLCTDDAVNGAPFYVMGFVDGACSTAPEKAEPLDPSSCAGRRAST